MPKEEENKIPIPEFAGKPIKHKIMTKEAWDLEHALCEREVYEVEKTTGERFRIRLCKRHNSTYVERVNTIVI